MVLIDTNAVIWTMRDRQQLSKRAAEAIQQAVRFDTVAIAGQTLWELALLQSLNKIDLRPSLADYLQQVERLFRVLPMTAKIAQRGSEFSKRYPRDPSDRIIGATALVHGLELVTSDDAIRQSGEVPCIW